MFLNPAADGPHLRCLGNLMYPYSAFRSWSTVLMSWWVESDIQIVLRWAGLRNTGLMEVKVADFISVLSTAFNTLSQCTLIWLDNQHPNSADI